jgi:hypothetical protein
MVALPTQTTINASTPLEPPTAIPGIPPVTSPVTGDVLSLDSQSLRLNGVPILPSGGEMHPSRVPRASWRNDLLKMKAGGLDVVSACVHVCLRICVHACVCEVCGVCDVC